MGLSTIMDSHRIAEHDIYISTSSNPYFNLALENWWVFAVYRVMNCLENFQVISSFVDDVSSVAHISWFTLRRNWEASESLDRNKFRHVEGCADTVHTKVERRGRSISRLFIICFVSYRSCWSVVYSIQDLGNSNFSIHTHRSSFNRQMTGELILRAVCSLGIDAHRNERNDILVGPDKISTFHSSHPSFSKHLNCSVRTTAYLILSTHIRLSVQNRK